jgi:hypothetical protein
VPGCPQRGLSARGDHDVDLKPDQLGREVGKPIRLALRVPELDDEILALHIPKIPQALREGYARDPGARVGGSQDADAKDLLRLLCLGRERRQEQAEGEGEDETKDAEPHGGVLQHTRARLQKSSHGVNPRGDPGELGVLAMEETGDGIHQLAVSRPSLETAGLLERQDPFHPPIALVTGCSQ